METITPGPREVQHRGNPHDGRATGRQQREHGGEHAEYHRRWQTGYGKPDSDQGALDYCCKSDAVEHAACDARQVFEELITVLLGHGDQALQTLEHVRPITQEEEHQEQHEEESHYRAERAHHDAAAE